MDEIPTYDEMAEVFNSLMSLSERYEMLYGSPRPTINKVLRFWGKLGLRELEKLEAMKYEPRMKAPTFPIYDDECNIIG